jgi:hypothetical protein
VQTDSTRKRICWSNGARLVKQIGANAVGFNYFDGSSLCFYGSWSIQSGAPTEYTFTSNGVDLLLYNRVTGSTTCLDGSQSTLAPDFGGCSAMTRLIELDDASCVPGTCN